MEGNKIIDTNSHGFKVSVMSNCSNHYLIRKLITEVLEENSEKNSEELKGLIEKKLKTCGIIKATVIVIKG